MEKNEALWLYLVAEFWLIFFVLFSINVKMFYFDFFFKEAGKIEYVLDIFHPK